MCWWGNCCLSNRLWSSSLWSIYQCDQSECPTIYQCDQSECSTNLNVLQLECSNNNVLCETWSNIHDTSSILLTDIDMHNKAVILQMWSSTDGVFCIDNGTLTCIELGNRNIITERYQWIKQRSTKVCVSTLIEWHCSIGHDQWVAHGRWQIDWHHWLTNIVIHNVIN